MPRGVSISDTALIQGRLWTPAVLLPFAWWDAANLSTITTVSGKVSEWRDSSGNGYTLSQATDARRPTLNSNGPNGLSVFDFSTSYMTAASNIPWTFLHSTTATVIAIMQFGVVSNPNALYAICGTNAFGTTVNGIVLYYDDRAGVLLNNAYRNITTYGTAGQYVCQSNNNNAITPNQINIIIDVCDPTNATASQRNTPYLNGTMIGQTNTATGVANTGVAAHPFQVGAGGNNTFQLTGKICELLIFDRKLSSSELQTVEGYATWKWGLQTSLISTHPYINRPPLI